MQDQSQSQGPWPWPHAPAEPPETNPGVSAPPAANDERIAAEAYRIAEEQGFPLNAALDHWFEAEKRIQDARRSGAGQA